jgi:hypothetical protein
VAEFRETSPEVILVGFLLEFAPADGTYRNDDMIEEFKRYLDANEIDFPKQVNRKAVGELLQRLGLVDKSTKKRAGRNEFKLYALSRQRIEEVARNYGLTID